ATARRCLTLASTPFFDPSGIKPNEGSPESACACSGVRTVLSMPSSRNARPMPVVSPRARAKERLRGTFGSAGYIGTRASSTGRMLLDLNPAVTPASFNFSSRLAAHATFPVKKKSSLHRERERRRWWPPQPPCPRHPTALVDRQILSPSVLTQRWLALYSVRPAWK